MARKGGTQKGNTVNQPKSPAGLNGEAGLWAGVIIQALSDSRSENVKTDKEDLKKAAIKWLTGKSRDFIEVCDLAQLNPHFVHNLVVNDLKKRNLI